MFIQILGVLLQVAGFFILCRLGGRVSARLYARSPWLCLAVGGPILVAMLVIGLIFHPAITFVVQTIIIWLFAFAGGIVAYAHERIKG